LGEVSRLDAELMELLLAAVEGLPLVPKKRLFELARREPPPKKRREKRVQPA
jgi:hypothetical protein